MKNPFVKAKFLKSAELFSQCPEDSGREIAFAGRSNAGKSSAINSLCQQRQLAYSSKTPGRTQLLNFFEIGDPELRLVDLPGYGYAKTPLAVKQRWEKELAKYFETRESLKGLVLLMDSRHPLKPIDIQLIDWAQAACCALCILLTKADKLSKNEAGQTLLKVQKFLEGGDIHVQLFSAHTGLGMEKLVAWLHAKLPL